MARVFSVAKNTTLAQKQDANVPDKATPTKEQPSELPNVWGVREGVRVLRGGQPSELPNVWGAREGVRGNENETKSARNDTSYEGNHQIRASQDAKKVSPITPQLLPIALQFAAIHPPIACQLG